MSVEERDDIVGPNQGESLGHLTATVGKADSFINRLIKKNKVLPMPAWRNKKTISTTQVKGEVAG